MALLVLLKQGQSVMALVVVQVLAVQVALDLVFRVALVAQAVMAVMALRVATVEMVRAVPAAPSSFSERL